ncbi:MAG: MliC family protein [Rhodobacteraceae bacterium]|nr:MliC family protein [Paracoccaceae bacterium]
MRGLTGLLALVLAVLPMAVLASPDVDFPQSGYSYGGKVRSGPGMNFRQIGSLYEGDPIVILNGTGAMMNDYEWFEIRYGDGQVGFQWGGLMCSQNPYPTIFRVCNGPHLQTQAPAAEKPQSFDPAVVNGLTVGRVLYPGGSFTNTNGVQWQEADANGQVKFHFQEESRNERTVYLFDGSRNVALELDISRGEVLYGLGTDPKTVLYRIIQVFAKGGGTAGGTQQPQSSDMVTVRYTCAEGLPLTVTYVNRGNGHAIFSIDGSPQERLEQVVSGSGARYSNGIYTLSAKGNFATLEHPSGVDQCYE